MGNTKHNYKLTNEQFIEALTESKGNYTLTSQYIQQKYDIPYSVPAVYYRVQKHTETTEKIAAKLTNNCPLHLTTFADDNTNDIQLRTKLYLHLLKKMSNLHLMHIKANAGSSLNQKSQKRN